MPALGGVLWRGGRCSRDGGLRSIFLPAGEFGYRSQQLTPMTERHPDLSKVLIGEIGQDRKADVVLGKALRVLPETELLKPVRRPAASRQRPGLSGFTRPHQLVYPVKPQSSSKPEGAVILALAAHRAQRPCTGFSIYS